MASRRGRKRADYHQPRRRGDGAAPRSSSPAIARASLGRTGSWAPVLGSLAIFSVLLSLVLIANAIG